MTTGLYETLLVVKGRPVLLEEHLVRLKSSAVALSIRIPALDEIRQQVAAASAEVAHLDEAMLRITCDGKPAQPDIAVIAAALPERVTRRRDRGRVITLDPSWKRTFANHKSWPNTETQRALTLATMAEADEALFCNPEGQLLEGTSTNLFAVSNNTIRTPPLNDDLLPGTMRAWIVANASRANIQVQEGSITKQDLAGGGFLTSSLTLLAVIRNLDQVEVPSCEKQIAALRQLIAVELSK